MVITYVFTAIQEFCILIDSNLSKKIEMLFHNISMIIVESKIMSSNVWNAHALVYRSISLRYRTFSQTVGRRKIIIRNRENQCYFSLVENEQNKGTRQETRIGMVPINIYNTTV